MSVISSKPFSGAIAATPESWVPIADGLEVLLPHNVQDGDCWDIVVTSYGTPNHLATAQVGESLFITSQQELLSQVQNNIVVCHNNTTHSFEYPDKPAQPHPNLRSSSLVFFFNHLFLAIDRTLWWTDLDNLWNWYPTTSNEADFRMLEWERHPIKALVKFNDVLFIHFPEALYTVEYVGKPSIVKIINRVVGSGAINARCVVCTKTAQYFLGVDNFYLWSVDHGLQPIGQEIWRKFAEQVTDWSSIWSYLDLRNSEICWVSGNIIWAFNYTESHWQKYDSNGAVDHATIPWNLINQLPSGIENLWVTPDGLCREQRPFEGFNAVLPYSTPYLETDEISYSDNHFHKKVDLVFLDCDYDAPWRAVNLLIDSRDYVSERTVWRWVGQLDKHKHRSLQQIDFPARQGRMLKFRFELVSNLDLKPLLFDGGLNLDENRPDLFNGLMGLGDVSQEFCGRQVRFFDGRSFVQPEMSSGRFKFYSWGQRVDVPQTLIGPDK